MPSTTDYEAQKNAAYQKAALEVIRKHIPGEEEMSAQELEKLWPCPDVTFASGALIGATFPDSSRGKTEDAIAMLTQALAKAREDIRLNPLPKVAGQYYYETHMPPRSALRAPKSYAQYHPDTYHKSLQSFCSMLVATRRDSLIWSPWVRDRLIAQIDNPTVPIDEQLRTLLHTGFRKGGHLYLEKDTHDAYRKITQFAERFLTIADSGIPYREYATTSSAKKAKYKDACVWIDPLIIAAKAQDLTAPDPEQTMGTDLDLA